MRSVQLQSLTGPSETTNLCEEQLLSARFNPSQVRLKPSVVALFCSILTLQSLTGPSETTTEKDSTKIPTSFNPSQVRLKLVALDRA